MLAPVLVLAALVAQAVAHCMFLIPLHSLSASLITDPNIDTFPALIVGGTRTGDWVNVRMTDNHYSNGPVCDRRSRGPLLFTSWYNTWSNRSPT